MSKHQNLITWLSLFVLAITPATAARAVDDGGGRSVFARGAGDRALALGGAFVAVADDPTTIVWNPAGLGRIDRLSLYASHTDLIGMGFSEQIGVVALPSWRLGTFSFAVRRFGVDGIEGRNDRGTLLDDNLKDVESEFSLGYGRAIGAAWNIGMNLKMQQHSLAGYSDGAFGLDLGLLVKPLLAAGNESRFANAFSLGLAFRNIVQPSLQLDQDYVRDPSGVRFGGAVQWDLGDKIGLLLTTDVEKTTDMDSRLHAGTELRLVDLLSLRVGSSAGTLAAGAGIRWQSLNVDYAFEDNPIEAVHRFGLGLAFGKTTTERRVAALDAQEALVQERMTEAFMRENQARLEGLMTEARRALAAGEYQEVLDKSATIRVLEPASTEAADLEMEAFKNLGLAREQAGDLSGATIFYQRWLALDPGDNQAKSNLQRVRNTSNKQARRSKEIRQIFDAALAEFAAGELPEARDGFARILELEPDDPEVRVMYQHAEQAIQLQAGSLLMQARNLIEAGKLAEARNRIARVELLAPAHTDLPVVVKELERRERKLAETSRAAARAAESASRESLEVAGPGTASPSQAPAFAELSPARQTEVADLYRRGMRALESGRRDDAIRYWEMVYSAAPDYQQVAQNLKQEYLNQGMEAFATGQLDRSIEIWGKALDLDPDDARTRGYLARANEHKNRIIQIRDDG